MQPEPTTQLDVDRRSVVRYVIIVLALGIPLLTAPSMTGLAAEPFILIVRSCSCSAAPCGRPERVEEMRRPEPHGTLGHDRR